MGKPRPIACRLHLVQTVEHPTSQDEANPQHEPETKQRRVEELSDTDDFGVCNLEYDDDTPIQDASVTKISELSADELN